MSAEPATDKLRGALLLDTFTISTAPQFFSLLSLMLRAAGMEIHVVSAHDRMDTELRLLHDRIPFTHVAQWDSYEDSRKWKYQYAMSLPKPVIWVDVAFTGWSAPTDGDTNVPGLVTLNWETLKNFGIPPPLKEVQ